MVNSSYQDRRILAVINAFTRDIEADVIGRHPLGNYLSIRQAYASAMREHDHIDDQTQLQVVVSLQKLQDQIIRAGTLASKLRRLLPGSSSEHPRDIYLWGGVGRGKTFLMDLFFGSSKKPTVPDPFRPCARIVVIAIGPHSVASIQYTCSNLINSQATAPR